MKPKTGIKKPKGAVWIERAIIESPFCVGLCQTENQFKNELKRLGVSESEDVQWVTDGKDATVTEFSGTKKHEKCFLVGIKQDKTTRPIEVIGLLVHEAVHVWQRIREDINEDKPSNEFEAYAIQNISTRLIDAYKLKKCLLK